jgi:protein tyrosine phosphatase (PTP) superfamily phosphohydrolase (DUF442 family)
MSIRGIENAFRLSPRLISGGQPGGAESFQALRMLGVKIIISVDGSEPEVAAAKRLGIKYIHIPIGYDGIPRERAIQIANAVKQSEGPIFLHCHHGKHRGPAAAAVCLRALDGWSRDQAVSWLKQAGTSADYPGLFAAVERFDAPSEREWAAAGVDFPEKVPAPPLVARMVTLDAQWDRVKALAPAQTGVDPRKRDDLAAETRQILETLRELGRTSAIEEKDPDFANQLREAETAAGTLATAARDLAQTENAITQKRVQSAMMSFTKTCTRCHAKHRDR